MEEPTAPAAFDAVTVITAGIGDLTTTLGGVAGPAIGIAATVLALTFGWRLVRRFVK
jgi:hypothetical protein